MAKILKTAWWTLLLRGIMAILFALLLLFVPGLTLATGALSIIVLFAVYALVDGISTIVGAVMHREGDWVLLLLLGVVSVIAGLAALANPLVLAVISIRVMVLLFAFKAISGGIMEILAGWQLRQEMDNEWLLILNGIVSLLFGMILLARPIAGVEVLILIAAFYLFIAGTLQIVLAFKVRGLAGRVEDVRAAATGA